MKILKAIIFFVISVIVIIVLTIAFMALLSVIKTKLFTPKEYIMWVEGAFSSRLSIIYEIYIVLGLFCIFSKNNRKLLKEMSENKIIKKCKKPFIYTFIILNIVLMYTVLFDVTVITNNKIIDYTFFSPRGKEYSYNDIVKIDTGVYGNKKYVPLQFTHSRGQWFYIIELKDGTKIDLSQVGASKIDDDPRFIIEKLDRQYVNMNISKVSSMDNFEYCAKDLAEIYSNKIRDIILNIK